LDNKFSLSTDLLLFSFNNDNPKHGLGLWDWHPAYSLIIELILTLSTTSLYLHTTHPRQYKTTEQRERFWCDWGPTIYIVDMIVTEVFMLIEPPGDYLFRLAFIVLMVQAVYVGVCIDSVRHVKMK